MSEEAYSRIFMFRAWDGGQMFSVNDTHPNLWQALMSEGIPGYTVMQFTGLRDKSGRDIYEGDIVEAWSEGWRGVFEVRWRQEAAPCFHLWPAWQNREMWYLAGRSRDKDGGFSDDGVTVLGNVFENPELRPKV